MKERIGLVLLLTGGLIETWVILRFEFVWIFSSPYPLSLITVGVVAAVLITIGVKNYGFFEEEKPG